MNRLNMFRQPNSIVTSQPSHNLSDGSWRRKQFREKSVPLASVLLLSLLTNLPCFGLEFGKPVLEKPVENISANAQVNLPVASLRMDGHVYQMELASTPEQSEKGLMYRTSLPEGHGMAFLFQPARVVYFWMKNTLIPLDIIFMEQGRVVHIASEAQPCVDLSCPVFSSVKPADMVIELPAGSVKRHHIQLNSHAKLSLHEKAPYRQQKSVPQPKSER